MVVAHLNVLFEHAVGYALFKVEQYEEIASSVPKVEKASLQFNNFKNMVKLISFSPFKTGVSSLENMLALSEGYLHEDLLVFLEKHGKSKMNLGVADPKIGTAIQEKFPYVNCQHTGIIPELLRGIRLHSDKLLGVSAKAAIETSEAGLARSFSRSKVKFNVNRADNMIIQSISLLDQLDKDINTFSMRLREWYSYHFPELVKTVNDNYLYARVARLLGDRKQMDDTVISEELKKLIENEETVNHIISAAKSSMGMDIAPIDLINISSFSSKVINLVEYRRQLMEYLQSRMHNVAPNLSALIGETVGARLISHAGSLINLAKYPASTVQILGAEKALFRALKTRGNTPKHGLLFHSGFISRAGTKNKGRISRFLANKCSIASRIDCFNDTPADVFGSTLKDQVEERLQFYENGTVPKKNIDVMTEASEKAKILADKRARKLAKKAKKEAAIKAEFDETVSAMETGEGEGVEQQKKKKKKKHDPEGGDEENGHQEEMEIDQESSSKKKKKKKKNLANTEDENGLPNIQDDTTEQIETESAKKKKKKRKAGGEDDVDQIEEDNFGKSNKKKKFSESDEMAANDESLVEETLSAKKKKKKKQKLQEA
ncbi:nucleolar protein 56-like [Panonychus citri]|uniref:nucleolar protein 56-like n=1 Tax=Panonychus citri TaxID=50023 RepID=UPI0023075F28|nr:nucleolar protein 56-like [Panonychus citri]